MPSPPHPAVLAVHDAARAVLDYDSAASTGSFWHRWFDKPLERHLADEVRAFVRTLALLLDVPPQMLSREDLRTVGEDADRVVTRIETTLDSLATPAGDVAAALTPAVYVIRARYEELHTRGATKE
jgi:hypothetical protein